MSRIGRLPVEVPGGVQVTIQGSEVRVKGPKGELKRLFSSRMGITYEAESKQILVTRPSDEKMDRTLHGTTRALIHNMVTGVSEGFTRILEVDGVGYRAELTGQNITFYLGYSHPVVVEPPQGISFEVDPKIRQITVKGFDKEQVGQVCANIRELRPPEPYKGKGIHYLGERLKHKAGKAGKGKGA